MLETLFGGPVADELSDGIFQETEGNPFFVEEVCRALLQDSRVSQQDGRWQAQVEIQDLRIPQSVRLAIQTRVARLPEEAQDTLRMAAVLGREFSFDILHAALDLDDDRLVDALELAARAQLIGEDRSRRTGRARPSGVSPSFVFEHALIPATLRDGVSSLRLQRMHRRAAAAYEALRPEDLESIGFHAAGSRRRGQGAQLLPASRASMRSSWARSTTPCGSTRRRSKSGRRTIGRDGQTRSRGWRIAAGWPSAATPWLRSRRPATCTRTWATTSEGATWSGCSDASSGKAGDRQTALLHYREALRILEQEPTSPELARAVSSMCQMHMLASEYDDCLAWGERALALAAQLWRRRRTGARAQQTRDGPRDDRRPGARPEHAPGKP